MQQYRILVVDDQIDIRRMFRSGLETLGSEFDVKDTPSGEEAMLEATTKPLDLLVSDIRLAGMSGLELMQKIRDRSPGIKVILISGLTDPAILREIASVEPDAFFTKPVPLGEFLDTVERLLGIAKPPPHEALKDIKTAIKSESIKKRLAQLKKSLDAKSVFLLEGDHWMELDDLKLDIKPHPGLDNSLTVLADLSRVVSTSLATGLPEFLSIISASQGNLVLSQVSGKVTLLVVLNKILDTAWLGPILAEVRLAVMDLRILQGLAPGGSPQAVVTTPPEALPLSAEEQKPLELIPDLFLDKPLVQTVSMSNEGTQDDSGMDADAATPTEIKTLSYEQARSLGILPDFSEGDLPDEEKDSEVEQ